MKTPLILCATLVLVINTSYAQTVVLNNNFDSVTTGVYGNGAAFGVASLLGNRSGRQFSPNTVLADIGVGATATNALSSGDYGIRTRDTLTTTEVTSFSLFNYYSPSQTSSQSFVNAGFALSAGADGPATFNAESDNRVMIGVAQIGSLETNAQFVTSGNVQSYDNLTGAPSMTIASGNWYQLSFDLVFNGDDTWTATDLNLRNWGSDGVTGGASVGSLASVTFNPTFGVNLDSNTAAYGFIAGNAARGGTYLDNALITVIPEPTSLVLLGIAGLTILVLKKRR